MKEMYSILKIMFVHINSAYIKPGIQLKYYTKNVQIRKKKMLAKLDNMERGRMNKIRHTKLYNNLEQFSKNKKDVTKIKVHIMSLLLPIKL